MEQVKEKLEQSLTCYSPSTELTAFDLLDAENTQKKLAFQELIPSNFHYMRLQSQLLSNPVDRDRIVQIDYKAIGK